MLALEKILADMDIRLKKLAKVLYAEQRALIEDVPVHLLSKIIDEKSKLLIELKLLDDNREKLGKRYDLYPPYNSKSTLMERWQSIVTVTKELSQVNHDNGSVLQTKINQTERSIQFLKSSNNTELYTNVGYKKMFPISVKRAEA